MIVSRLEQSKRAARVERIFDDTYSEWLYTIKPGEIKKRRRIGGVWVPDERTPGRRLYYTCPCCVQINGLNRKEFDGAAIRRGYYSFHCHRCMSHLWLLFKSLNW